MAKRLAFSFFAILICLILLEGLFRALGFGLPRSREVGYQESKFQPSSSLIWELVPGWKGWEGIGEIRINSLGIRDNEIAVPKPKNEKRILCLGDSVTFGYLLGQEDTYPQVLEKFLEEATHANFEVINAGVPGYSTFQEITFLEEKGWNLSPDTVLLGYVLNDVVERYSAVAEFGGKDVFLGVDTTFRLSKMRQLARKSATYRFIAKELRTIAKQREIYNVRRLFDDELSPKIQTAWDKNMGEIKAMKDECTKEGVDFLLVIFPFAFQLNLDLKKALPQQRLMRFARAEGIDFIDLLPTFIAHRAERLYMDQDHLSPAGHRLAAKEIFKFLNGKL